MLESGLFDPEYYLQVNQGVSADNISPIDHFMLQGALEGKKPHPLFDPEFYCRTYPDVGQARINPLFHYLQYGGREGRVPHPLFDPVFYLTQIQPVELNDRTPLEHFVEQGVSAGLNPNACFSTRHYQSQYADILRSGENPLSHYVCGGLRLGTDPHPLFITQYYRDAYPDVTSTGIHPLHHFIRHGAREGRDSNPLFDRSWYSETFGSEKRDWPGAEAHFEKVGVPAKFDASPGLSTEYYLKLHPEVAEGNITPVDHLLRRYAAARSDRSMPFFAPLRLWLRDMHRHEMNFERKGDLISFIIPCYNQGIWLEDALLSIYFSTSRPLDIIIIDDGSTDRETIRLLPDLAAQYGARLISQENKGLSGARNTGLKEADGEYIQFLDCDDLLLRGKIDRQLNLGPADIYLSDYFLCNSWCGDWTRPFPSTVKGFPFTYQSFLRNWERGLSVPIHCGLFARSVLEGFTFDRELRAKEDWRMWLQLLAKEPRVSFLDSPEVLYRQHTSNMGHNPARMGEEFLRAAFKTVLESGDNSYFEDALKHFSEVYVAQIRLEARNNQGGA